MEISINQYLATHSRKRNLDKVIIKWMQAKESIPKNRTKESWDEIISGFYGETEKKKFKIVDKKPIEIKRQDNKKKINIKK